MNKLLLGTITQTGSFITADFTAVTNQYSSDTLEITFNLDQTYSGALSAALELLADDRSLKAVVPVIDQKVTLPGYVTQYPGILRIALAWIDGSQVATTDAVELEVIPSVDPAGSPPPSFEIWLTQLHTYMDIYLHEQIDPDMQTLLSLAQKAVNEAGAAVSGANKAVNDVNDAVIAAGNAASEANSAATNANNKASAAQAAANAANVAEASADAAASSANAAATNAGNKAADAQKAAVAANTAKQAADTAAADANDAAAAANSAATAANAAKKGADTAAKTANDAASAASTSKAAADTAAKSANDAADKADTAAANANSKASSAQTASVAANNAADAANTSKQEADASAEKADTAAANANSKAELAQTAATAANNAASAANMAKQSADTAAKSANDAASAANVAKGIADTAAESATEAASKANTAANNADTKAKLANDSAAAANAAATNANSKATTAADAAKSANDAVLAANTAKENADASAKAADNAAGAANTAKQSADAAASNAQSVADDLIKKRDAGEFNGSPVQLQKNTTHLQWKLQNESAWKNLIALLDLIGATPQIKVGTVTTLAAGTTATVTIGGTVDEPVFNFGIPKGQDGKGSGDMLKDDYDADGDGIVDLAKAVPWSGITGKPSTFAPSSHNHTIGEISNFPTSLPANGGDSDTVSGHSVLSDVPADAKFTDTIYKHPSYTARSSGLYKITVDASGHVNAVDSVTKDDITALGIPGKDTNTVYVHPVTAGNKHIPAGGAAGQILRWSADGTAAWGEDNNTTYSVFKAASASAAGGSGLVPAPAAGKQASYLRGDGQWVVPTNTTYAVMTGATASAAGKAGLVPAPAASKQTSFLRGDGSWVVPPNTTYGLATASANGLMSAADKAKMDKLKDESVIRNVTIATSAFVANTDDNAAQYPYCADYTVSGMTATCWANVNLSAASKALGVIEQGNTMAGKLRLYANAVPASNIVIDNIVWKEVG